MKKSYFFLSLVAWLFIFNLSFGQIPGQWTWVHGDNYPNSTGSFGLMGVTAPTNKPPALYEANNFKDLQGNIWLYGGGSGTGYDDLWKYNPVINQWTWVSGSQAVSYGAGNFGTITIPAPTNHPPGIGYCAATWTDTTGDLWMFGGRIGAGLTNALWRYNIATNMWTWMTGSSAGNGMAVYGTQGIPAPTNTPGSLQETNAAWTDSSNNLWMYGGLNGSTYSVLWKYSVATNEWTWIQGSTAANVPAVYGTKGVPSPTNTPGGRWVYSKWKSCADDYLWLFGGENSGYAYVSDLWRYSISTNEWTWMSGSSVSANMGNYIGKCAPDSARYPSARFEGRCCWTDACNNFWLFGGADAKNDLWNYVTSTNQWNWVSGDSTSIAAGNYGVLNVSSPSNMPQGRQGAIGFTDANGYFYVFGGTQSYSNWFNDLFRYVPDSNCVANCSLSSSSCFSPCTLHASFTSSDTAFCDEAGKCIDFYDHSTCNPTSWHWSFPGAAIDTSSQQNPTNICYYYTGTYPVTLIVSNSTGSDTLVVSPHIIFANAPPPPTVTVVGGDTLYSSHEVGYQWYRNGILISGATDSFYVVVQSGTYSVQGTDSLGCYGLSNGVFITGISSLTSSKAVTLYPNPASDELMVAFDAPLNKDVEIIISTMIGQELDRRVVDGSTLTHSFSLKDLANGIYMLQVRFDKQTINKKFVVLHR